MMARYNPQNRAVSIDFSQYQVDWKSTHTSAVVVREGPAGGAAWLSCDEDRSRFADTPLVIGRLDVLVGAG